MCMEISPEIFYLTFKQLNVLFYIYGDFFR